MEHLSDKQREWLAHVDACGNDGSSMKAYAERHGLRWRSTSAANHARKEIINTGLSRASQ